jgi:membrane protease YdiL (CAAX protease family)
MMLMSSPYNPVPDGELLPPGPPPYEPSIPPPVENPPWTFREVLFLTLIAIVFVALFQVVAIGIVRHRHPLIPIKDLAQNARIVLPAQVLAYLALLGCMVMLLRSRGLHFWKAIRWHWPTSRWLGFAILGVLLSVIIQVASALLPIPKQLPIDQFFADTVSAYLLAIFGVTLAPLMEELFFRGFLYPVLVRRLGIPVAVAITSLTFALIHESQLNHAWGPLLLLFFVGVALTMARVHTGSVATSFLIHVGYNATLFTVMYFVTDHFRHLENMK